MASRTTSAPAAPIVHRKKAELAYERLREEIVNGTHEPGQRMTLAELAADLGLSHMPVREALLRLEREGLLESEPHKGMRVARLSPDEAKELFEIRAELEGLAAYRACINRDPKIVSDLTAVNRRFLQAHEAEAYTEMGEANWTFHRRVLQAAASVQLSRLLEDVWTRSFRYRLGYRLIPDRALNTIREHKRIIAAFRAGDPEKARRAAREHIMKAGVGLERMVQDGAEE